MCFDFLYNFLPAAFLILIWTDRNRIKNAHNSSCKVLFTPILSLRLLMSYIYIYIYIYILYDISSLRINDLTLILLTWRKWWAPNNASKHQMGFKSAFKGLMKLEFSRQIFEKYSNIKFQWQQSFLHVDRRMDRHT